MKSFRELFPFATIKDNYSITQISGDAFIEGHKNDGDPKTLIMVDGHLTSEHLRALADWMEGK